MWTVNVKIVNNTDWMLGIVNNYMPFVKTVTLNVTNYFRLSFTNAGT